MLRQLSIHINKMMDHISFFYIRLCIYLFQSKHCLPGKLKDVTEFYYFSDSVASQYKTRKNFITSAVIKMNLIWTPGDISLQRHLVRCLIKSGYVIFFLIQVKMLMYCKI
jgi:hypothetical protein